MLHRTYPVGIAHAPAITQRLGNIMRAPLVKETQRIPF